MIQAKLKLETMIRFKSSIASSQNHFSLYRRQRSSEGVALMCANLFRKQPGRLPPDAGDDVSTSCLLLVYAFPMNRTFVSHNIR